MFSPMGWGLDPVSSRSLEKSAEKNLDQVYNFDKYVNLVPLLTREEFIILAFNHKIPY